MAKEQVSSILRALEILECFMDNETEWTLKRLVAQLDLPTTTVHRQLSTLTDRGYLVQDPVRKSYRVGPRLLLLSSTVLSHSDLRSTARPELEKLSATVKETINLSVMLDREIFIWTKWRPSAPWCATRKWAPEPRPTPPAAARSCWPFTIPIMWTPTAGTCPRCSG